MSRLTSQQLQELYEDMDGQLRQQIYSWFKSLDKDNSGYLDPAEFYAARKAMQLEDEIQTEQQLKAYIDRFDADNDGQLDLYEFCYILIDLMGGQTMSAVENPAPLVEEPKAVESVPAEAITFDMKRPEEEQAGVPATMDEPAPESGFDDDSASVQQNAEQPEIQTEPEPKAEIELPAEQDNVPAQPAEASAEAADEPEFDF